jgi:hypothetical protein
MPWRDSSPMDLKTQFIADYAGHFCGDANSAVRLPVLPGLFSFAQTVPNWRPFFEQVFVSGLDNIGKCLMTQP